MKSDILFFNPPQTNNGQCLKNYTLLWIASYLKRRGFDAKVIYLKRGYKIDIKKALSRYHPEFVAISCKWYTTLYGAILVAKEIRKIDKKIKIIAGGDTATYFAKEILSNSDFDIVIRGDAELPLLNILNNKIPINCTLKKNGKIIKYEQKYIQTQEKLKNHTLVNPREILKDPRKILSGLNIVWIGKGCVYNCFYCGGSANAQKKIFGRKTLVYRPIKDVLHDIKIFSKYSKTLLFDFPSPTTNHTYYTDLFTLMPQKKFSCTFYWWQLPNKNLIEQISKTFKFAIIGIDVLTFSESLRKVLSKKRLTKPFFSNQDLENVISYCNKKTNIDVNLESIAGLPGERDVHVKKHTDFAKYLIRKYPVISSVTYAPLSIEPASILQKCYNDINMCCNRNTFEDYLNLTKWVFKENITYDYSEFFLKKKFRNIFMHPYGVHEVGLSEKNTFLKIKHFYDNIYCELKSNSIYRQYIRQRLS